MKNISKLLCVALTLAMLCCGFAGCQQQDAPGNTETPTTQSNNGGLEISGGFGTR